MMSSQVANMRQAIVLARRWAATANCKEADLIVLQISLTHVKLAC